MKVYGQQLVHNYKEKTNWDGSYCSDYCIGCGACDHYPTNYVVSGYKENVKNITYHCKKCNEKRALVENVLKMKTNKDETKKIDYIIDLKNEYEVDETDIEFVSCNDCKFRIRLKDSYQREHEYQRIVCVQCGEKNGDNIMEYARCCDTFYCCECKKVFEIEPLGQKVECENII